MVYRLDAVDAYERKLVKQIEVASATIEDAHNKPYVRLLSTANKRGTISARIELDVESAGKVRRQETNVMHGEKLEQTTGRAVYQDCLIGDISVKPGNEMMELQVPGDQRYLRLGEHYGDVDSDRRRARDDPADHPGTSGQGETPPPSEYQGAQSLFYRRRESVPPVRSGR